MRRGRASRVARRRFPLVWGFWIGPARKCRTKPSPSPERLPSKQISPRSRRRRSRSLGTNFAGMGADSHDTIVVGAGILGLAVAREILARRPAERVLVLEREAAPATHQSSHNSGVVHGGIYYAPGSLKARLCVDGAARLYAYCEAHAIDVRRIGKLIVALTPRRAARARRAAAARARQRRAGRAAPGRRRPARRRAARRPASPRCTSPGTGIVDFGAVCGRLAADVAAAGGELRCGWPVDARVRDRRGAIRLRSAHRRRGARRARRLLRRAVVRPPRRPRGRRPRPADRPLPRRLPPAAPGAPRARPRPHLPRARPAPAVSRRPPHPAHRRQRPRSARRRSSPARATATGAGALRAADLRDTLDLARHLADGAPLVAHGPRPRRAWPPAPRAFAAAAARYVPAIGAGDLLPAFAGVRAQAVGRDGRLVDDFVLSATPRAIHVRNAPSPAATSALALAALIADHADELADRPRLGAQVAHGRRRPAGPFPPARATRDGRRCTPHADPAHRRQRLVGAALAPALAQAGHDVRGFGRDPARVPATLDFVRGDAISGAGLDAALDGIDVAYFLIHSMEGDGRAGFEDNERAAAENFVAAAQRRRAAPRRLPRRPRPAGPPAVASPAQPPGGRADPARGAAGGRRAARLDRHRRALALLSLHGPSRRADAGPHAAAVARAPHPADRCARRRGVPARGGHDAARAGRVVTGYRRPRRTDLRSR